MSAEACLAFFGIRYEISRDELPLLEQRKDPRMREARLAGLKHYWGDFGGAGDRYYLFIGYQIGILGVENQLEVEFTPSDIESRILETQKRLRDGGFQGEPRLYLQWIPD